MDLCFEEDDIEAHATEVDLPTRRFVLVPVAPAVPVVVAEECCRSTVEALVTDSAEPGESVD